MKQLMLMISASAIIVMSMTNVLTHGAPETHIVHYSEVPFRRTQIANTVQSVLNPKSHTVETTDTIADLERIFSIRGLGPSLLLGIKSLIGKTLIYDGMRVRVQESGTSFAVRPAAANDERFALAA
jgi:hypothetical protein